MTAEEHLIQIQKFKRIIRNADNDIRIYKANLDMAEDKLKSCIKKRDEAVVLLGTVEEAIEAMPTSKYKQMLKLYYIDDQTWEFIAETMNYSLTQIYKYRPLALEEFTKTWENMQKVK